MVTKIGSAKGFRIQKSTARLVFAGDYEGAEIVVRLDVPVSVFIEIQDMVSNEQQLKVFELFGAKVLQEWNLENDDGNPVPATSDGMQTIPLDFANLIIEKWVEVSTQPSAPLD